MKVKSKIRSSSNQYSEENAVIGNLSTTGINNSGSNCLLQIITNYSQIFQLLIENQPKNEIETQLYSAIQKMVQSENPISINSFLTEVGRDFHYNIANQQNFFDILNKLCRNVPIFSKL